MADGIVFTGDTGIAIDNTLVGTTVYRQRIVIGGDSASSGFVNPSTVWPTSSAMGLPVRIIGSSGVVLGSVAQSSAWNISTGAVVGLTTTATVGLTTTNIVSLSSALSNYITNSTTVPVYLGNSTTNIVGIVGLSSAVTLSSGALTLGTLTTGTIVNLSTTSVVGLTTTSVVGLTTTSIVNLSSALTNYVTNSTTVPVYLGASTSNIVGIVGLSSAVTLSSGALTLGTLTTGTVVLLTTGSVVGLTTTAVVGLTTTNLVGLSTTANIVSGVVAGVAPLGTISSGNVAPFMVDRDGRVIVSLSATPQMLKSVNLSVAANTCQQQLLAAQGAGLCADLLWLGVGPSTVAATTAIASTFLMFFTSSGQAEPGVFRFTYTVAIGPTPPRDPVSFEWNAGLPQPTANNPWWVVASSSGSQTMVQINALFRVRSS